MDTDLAPFASGVMAGKPKSAASVTRRAFLGVALGSIAASRLNGLLPWRPPTRAQRRRVGLSVHRVDPPALALLKTLGVTQVRITLYWREFLEPRRFTGQRVDPRGTTRAEDFRADFRALRAAGLDVLVVVHTPPTGMTLDQGIVEFPRFLAERAVEFPGTTWEVLNEMDAEDAWDNGWLHAADRYSGTQQGALYGRLLAPVYDAVKAADRSAQVICGGIANDPVPFFDGLSRAAPGKYDAIAVHCYGQPVIAQFRSKSVAMRRALGRTPLWCTEWGYSTTDDALQARELQACLDDNDQNDRYDRNYIYALATDATVGDHCGIATFTGAMRPAANQLMDRTAS